MFKITINIILFFLSYNYVISQSPVLLPGFPKLLDSISGQGYSPIVADFNNNGNNEILISYYASQGKSKIYLLNENGISLNLWPVFIYDDNSITAAGDINNDGYINVVVRSKDSIFVFDHTGNPLPGFPVYFPSGASSSLALYDLENDGNLEIITTGFNKVSVINYNGLTRQGWPVELFGSIINRVYTSPVSIVDLNEDGFSEIIVPSSYCPDLNSGVICTDNFINIFKTDGKPFFQNNIRSDSGYFYQFNPASVYSENDSNYFILNSMLLDNNDNVFTRTFKYNSKGDIVNKFFSSSFINTSGAITIGNINVNSQKKIFSFGYQNSPCYLLNEELLGISGWPVNSNNFYLKPSLIQNFNTDNYIITTENYADTTGGFKKESGYIRFFNISGNELSFSPLRSDGIPVTSPTFCDLNRDGILDMVCINSVVNNSINGFGKMMYAWTFPGVIYDIKNIQWPMYGHDRYRTNQYGFIPPDDPIGILPINNIVPDKFELHQNYPNPFNPVTNIKFDINKSTDVRLNVYDALGRKISSLINEKLQSGSYNVLFDGSNFASGVYFYKLDAGVFVQTKRMILLK